MATYELGRETSPRTNSSSLTLTFALQNWKNVDLLFKAFLIGDILLRWLKQIKCLFLIFFIVINIRKITFNKPLCSVQFSGLGSKTFFFIFVTQTPILPGPSHQHSTVCLRILVYAKYFV